MRRSAALVATWRAQDRDGVLARPVDAQGLGPRAFDDLLLVDANGKVAGTCSRAPPTTSPSRRRGSSSSNRRGHALVGIDIDFDDATAAGLTCGGHVAEILAIRSGRDAVSLRDTDARISG